jgi:hypothetical protein
MRWLLLFFILLIIASLGVYGAGSALPEEVVTIKGAQLNVPVEDVWQKVTDYPAMPKWNESIATVTPVPNPDTKEVLWDLEDGNGRHQILKVVASVEKTRHQVEIIENDLPFLGSWKFEFSENKGGTWLRLEEHAVIQNPFLRFFVYYILGAGKGAEDFLHALGNHFMQNIEVKNLAA